MALSVAPIRGTSVAPALIKKLKNNKMKDVLTNPLGCELGFYFFKQAVVTLYNPGIKHILTKKKYVYMKNCNILLN